MAVQTCQVLEPNSSCLWNAWNHRSLFLFNIFSPRSCSIVMILDWICAFWSRNWEKRDPYENMCLQWCASRGPVLYTLRHQKVWRMSQQASLQRRAIILSLKSVLYQSETKAVWRGRACAVHYGPDIILIKANIFHQKYFLSKSNASQDRNT